MRPSFAFAGSFALAVLVACGPSTDTDAGPTAKAGEPCTTCGAAPEFQKLCSNGPNAKAICVGRADGTCGWDFEDCPPAPRACGIRGQPSCAPGQFCELSFDKAPRCGADLRGVCAPIPQSCPQPFDPACACNGQPSGTVCGCDGWQYRNDCEAAARGVNVDYKGPCRQVRDGGACGTRRDLAPCMPGSFCKWEKEGFCSASGVNAGICTKRPLSCDETFEPVCSCDGKDYTNPCEANRAGTSVQRDGPCRPVP
jgi:hypothetical protein